MVCSLGLAAKQKKTPRTVTGVVSDETDNPIDGAAVELTDLQTGVKTAMYSHDGGHYQFSDLKTTRDYQVQATYRGRASEARKVSMFDDRNKIVLPLRIPSSPSKPQEPKENPQKP